MKGLVSTIAIRPHWSPDGSAIAFVSEGAIHLMNPDGSSRRPLTNRLGRAPIWSPEGTKIAFGGNDAIYVVDADGTNELRLSPSVWTQDRRSLQGAVNDWRLDHDRRATTPWPILEGGDDCIGTVDTLTGALTEERCNPYIDIAALAKVGLIIYSDPSRIESANTALNTTATNLESGPLGWYIDESGAVNSVPGFVDVALPRDLTWSPDGAKIAFAQFINDPPNSVDIMVIGADGSDLTRLTHAPGYSSGLTWSPDGAKIAFRSGNEIQVISADGSGLVNLSEPGTLSTTFLPGLQMDPCSLSAARRAGTGLYVL